MATGLGKTVTFSQIPRRGRELILSHREELVNQPIKYYNCAVGVEQACRTSGGEEVVSASVPSLVRRLERFKPDDFDIVIVDEAHHSPAPSYQKILDYFKPRLRLGFSATPNRGDRVRLDKVFDKIIFQRDIKWGIKNGYLTDIYCVRADIGFDLRDVAARLGDFASDELGEAMNTSLIHDGVADAYRKRANGQTLIFAANVECANEIAKRIDGAVAVSAKTENRAEIVEAFKNRLIPCLVNCMVFTEGTDIPNIETIIVARPTANVSLYTQMVGRGLRLSPGKEKLTLIDCVGVSGKLSLCTAPSLLGIDAEQVPKRKQNEIEGDLFDLPEKIKDLSDTPQSWVKNLQVVNVWAVEQKLDTHNMNFFLMPDGSLKLSLPDRQSYILPCADELGQINGRPAQEVIDELYKLLEEQHAATKAIWDLTIAKKTWGKNPASEAQKRIIARRFNDFDTDNLTKLEAAQILNRIMK
jgi:superfamily II DNA or RNA helicase